MPQLVGYLKESKWGQPQRKIKLLDRIAQDPLTRFFPPGLSTLNDFSGEKDWENYLRTECWCKTFKKYQKI